MSSAFLYVIFNKPLLSFK